MAFEREAIVADSSNVPTQMTPIMREDRILNPYAVRTPKAPITPPSASTGQMANNREAEPEATVAPEETVRLSPQMAALARREQKFRQQQLQFEKQRAAIVAQEAELAELRAMKQKLAAKDYSALDGMIDYDEYSQYQVNKLNGADPVQDNLRALSAKVDEFEKTNKEQVERQYEAAFEERKIAASDLIDADPAFSKLKLYGESAPEAVAHHIRETLEKDGVQLSVRQATQEVLQAAKEKAEQDRKEAAAFLEETKETPIVEETKPLPPLKPQMKTLTNQVTSGEMKRPTKSLHHMSDAERWAEARRRVEERMQLQQARS